MLPMSKKVFHILSFISLSTLSLLPASFSDMANAMELHQGKGTESNPSPTRKKFQPTLETILEESEESEESKEVKKPNKALNKTRKKKSVV